jgi:hypothetical protein
MIVMNKTCQALSLLVVTFIFFQSSQATAQASHGFAGKAMNVAVATSAAVELFVSTEDNKSFRAKGAFDGIKLAGVFDLYGRKLPLCKEADLCLQFFGAIELGGIGGWPRGTKTTFVLTLAITAHTGAAIGVYHIGPLAGADFTQYGILNLKKKK